MLQQGGERDNRIPFSIAELFSKEKSKILEGRENGSSHNDD